MFSGLGSVFSLGNLQNAYNGISKAFKLGYDTISSPFRSFGHLVNGIDHYLNMANKLPFLSNISRLIQGNPLYAELLASNTDIQSLLDVIEKGGSEADDIIRRLLKFDDDDQTPSVPQIEGVQRNLIQSAGAMTPSSPGGGVEISDNMKTAIQ